MSEKSFTPEPTGLGPGLWGTNSVIFLVPREMSLWPLGPLGRDTGLPGPGLWSASWNPTESWGRGQAGTVEGVWLRSGPPCLWCCPGLASGPGCGQACKPGKLPRRGQKGLKQPGAPGSDAAAAAMTRTMTIMCARHCASATSSISRSSQQPQEAGSHL